MIRERQNTCTIDVPAPGFALVVLTDDGDIADSGKGGAGEEGGATMTFATTERTKTRNTATADPSLLATSNGYRMSEHEQTGTSKPPSGAPRAAALSIRGAGRDCVVVARLISWSGWCIKYEETDVVYTAFYLRFRTHDNIPHTQATSHKAGTEEAGKLG
ncbi:hypothetical protein B0H13DRAFT_1875599 [Mycena leptocephala]|nr:hypothetical protein B0H13DRAFT_1875599 [Mycena leptocephala]